MCGVEQGRTSNLDFIDLNIQRQILATQQLQFLPGLSPVNETQSFNSLEIPIVYHKHHGPITQITHIYGIHETTTRDGNRVELCLNTSIELSRCVKALGPFNEYMAR